MAISTPSEGRRPEEADAASGQTAQVVTLTAIRGDPAPGAPAQAAPSLAVDEPKNAAAKSSRSRFKLGRLLKRGLRNSRQIAVDVGLLAVVLAGAATTLPSVMQRAILIEPISTPSALEERGYSAEVLARRIRDELRQLYLQSRHIGQTIGVADVGADAKIPEVEVPLASISLRTVVASLRELAGLDDLRVTGEITTVLPAVPAKKSDEDAESPPPRYVMRLREIGKGSFHVSPKGDENIDTIVRDGAIAMLEELNPALAARWYERRIRLDDLERVIRKMEATTDPKLLTEAAIMRGNLLMRRRKTDEAVRQYEQILATSPQEIRARLFRAQALLRGGRFEAAVQAADEALAADPQGAAVAHAFKGDAYSFLGRMQEAEASANRAKELLPRNGQSLVTLSYIYMRRDELDRALEAAKQAVIRDPDLPTGYVVLGNVLRRMGRIEEGLAEVARGHGMDPTNQFSAASHVRHLRLSGRLKQADETVEQALKEDPGSALLNTLAAQVKNDLENHAPALTLSERSISLRAKNVDAQAERSRALLGLKRYDEARAVIDVLQGQRIVDPDLAPTVRATGIAISLRSGDLARAEREMEEWRSSDGSGAAFAEIAGEIAFAQKRWSEATRLFRSAIAQEKQREHALKARLAQAVQRAGKVK